MLVANEEIVNSVIRISNNKLPNHPTVDELCKHVVSTYDSILSKLPPDDPGVFIYYHPDADIDTCLSLIGAPVLLDANGNPIVPGVNIAQSAQTFKAHIAIVYKTLFSQLAFFKTTRECWFYII
jgi:hypothetical protein